MFDIILYNEQGQIERKSASTIKEGDFKDTEKVWIDIADPTWEELMQVKEAFSLHSLTIEDCFSKRTRIKYEEFRKYTYVVFLGLEDIKERVVKKVNLNYIFGANFLVTTQFSEIVEYEKLKTDSAKLKDIFEKGKGMEFVLHKLIDQEVDRYFPYVYRIDDTVDKAETEISKGEQKKLLDDLFKFKREVVYLERKINSMRRVIASISEKDIKYLDPDIKIYFRDVLDHIERLLEIMSNYRDLVNNTLDIHLSITSVRTNDIIRVLTIITTIMMPLTVIAGIYGMNFEVMPELRFKFGYFAVIGFMLLLSGGLLLYFKKKNWL